jgi:hypothetical protein
MKEKQHSAANIKIILPEQICDRRKKATEVDTRGLGEG